MSDLMTCKVCGWRGPNCPAFPQFDDKNRCFHCQPAKRKKKQKDLAKEEKYKKDNIDYGHEKMETIDE